MSSRTSGQAKWPGIRVVGLTGGIAAGKSTVSGMLASLGAVVIDADRLSRQVTGPGSPGLARVREVFGERAVTPDGKMDRHGLARIIFHDEAARSRLNAIIHPLVMERTGQMLRELQAIAGTEGRLRVAVIDAPLLFEAGADALCDEIWVVAVSREDQAARLMRREGYSLEEACSRIDAQMPLEEKKKRATEIIHNEGTIEETRQRVLELWRRVGAAGAGPRLPQ